MKRYLLAVLVFSSLTILTANNFHQPAGYNIRKNEVFIQNSALEVENAETFQRAKENFANLPLIFEENRGQTDERVKYFTRGSGGYTLFLTESAAVISLQSANAKESQIEKSINQAAQSSDKNENPAVLQVKTVGSNPPTRIEALDEQIAKTNYLLGEDENKWLRDVPNFAKVLYAGIYRGVDLVYYGNGKHLEYDFVVSPKADPKQIAVKFDGAKNLEIDGAGDLLIQTENGSLRQHKPFIYQETNGERREIPGKYVLKNESEIGFEIGEYDDSKTLVIDPVLAYATYLGSSEYEISNGIAVDAAGNAYVTGYAKPPAFPTTPGSFRPTITNPMGDLLTFVAKFNSSGSALLYSTYLGGAGEGIAVDAAGNAYTTGYPYPNLFTTTPGALDTGSEKRIGVTKLNPQGNQRVYAARFGSTGGDLPTDIAIDSSGNAYVTGTTNCAAIPPCDFPILNAPQPNYSGGGDMFVSKLNASGSALVYSTYVGGNSSEHPNGIDVDAAGNAYISGYTFSFNFPTTPGAFDTTYACSQPPFCRPDTFVTKIAAAGSSFAYSTYLGGLGDDTAWGIAVDDGGNAYVAGYTDGRFSGAPNDGFPTTPGAFKMFGSVEAFVTKLNPNGSALVYSTLLGGSGSSCADERARDVDVDRLGHAYVVGLTTCNNFPVANAMQPAPSSFQPEGFVTKFNPSGTGLVYSSYLGGPRYDEAYDIAVDASGAAYITGTTSGDFQLITPGAYDTTWNCGQFCEHPDDIFVMKINGDLDASRSKIADFDGDGRSDASVFRGGNWYIQQSQAGFRATQFGLSSDKPVPGDYDGDRKTDIAVFRRGDNSTWYILQSSNQTFRAVQWGATNVEQPILFDRPVPADYDGDGKTDLAVWRLTDNLSEPARFLILQSSNNNARSGQWGNNQDTPVPADYDGDGKADFAVFRHTEGNWYVLRTTDNNFSATRFGLGSDKLVPADYDGDDKTDVAVFRDGVWYALRSRDGFFGFQFGIASDKPVPADYDGDGKTDVAVFRNGVWYLQQSAGGFAAFQFGLSEDIPVPSSYFP